MAAPDAQPAARCETVARRLTGPNLWLEGCGVAVDVRADCIDAEALFAAFARRCRADHAALGWPAPTLALRRHRDAAAPADGVALTLAVSAPLDRLYAATAGAELAVVEADGGRRLAAMRAEADVDGDPRLRALAAAAAAAGVPRLWDDDEASVGFGRFAHRWPRAALPAPEDAEAVVAALVAADPAGALRVPVAMITGTNGKTTTTRLLARIARFAGRRSGATSTDGLVLDGAVVEAGDWTGPGGARAVLRDRRVELALLETARGGLLRRGIATTGVDAAVVTNVSDDHLGEWGVGSVAEMAEVKLLVAAALRPAGRLCVFDDDGATPGPLMSALRALRERWQSSAGGSHPRVLRYRADAGDGGLAGWRDGDAIVIDCGADDDAGRPRPPLRLPLDAIPITLGGLADHNVANAIAAALLARGLGLPDDAIAAGLADFKPSASDSPGRSNVFTLRGARVLLDFGHNPDGVARVADLARRVAATRVLVVIGQAGDRSDAEIRGLVEGLLRCAPERWLLKAMPRHARGREVGAVVALLRDALAAAGVGDERISVHPSEDAAARAALAELAPGDLLLLLAHEDPAGVLRRVEEAGATAGWP